MDTARAGQRDRIGNAGTGNNGSEPTAPIAMTAPDADDDARGRDTEPPRMDDVPLDLLLFVLVVVMLAASAFLFWWLLLEPG